VRRAFLAAALLAAATAFAPFASAEEGSRVPDAHVAEALGAAGANRAELERFLSRYAEGSDAEKREASRFLVANLPGKGHVLFELRDAKGEAIPFDSLSFPTFAASQEALDAIEKERGTVDFVRAKTISDVETVKGDFLARHLDRAFEIWRATAPARRVAFDVFLEHLLPYRGSEEPVEDWLGPLSASAAKDLAEPDAAALYRRVSRDAGRAVRFDERYYLHPTDQGFAEMQRTKMGRCEDITNRTTYGARAVGLATAADYTPAWGHRDNNHAWNVLLDAAGRGSSGEGRRAAKVYRKTFALQRDGLASRLPPGREAPNRWLGGRSYVDVTDQYGPTSDVEVALDAKAAGETNAYLCVFNGGEWVAIAWAPVTEGRAVFRRAGRSMLYLPAVHDGKTLVPAASPLVVRADGSVHVLAGEAEPVSFALTATSPEQRSPDTKEVTPVSTLRDGVSYRLDSWKRGAWSEVGRPGKDPASLRSPWSLPSDGLHWLVEEGSRRLERPFTIEGGRQRFW
jgi:hypothetical protein